MWAAVLWWQGIIPVVYRFGKGLANAKIAVFATGNEQTSLTSLLVDSGMFRAKNLISISTPGDIGKAEKANLFIVHWPSWRQSLDDVLAKKTDGTGIIVYAPREGGQIPEADMGKLNRHRNVALTNFRGRLLSDILLSMITSSCEK